MLGDRIHALLADRELTASDLARAVGKTPQAAHQWITNETLPKAKTKEKIAEFFGMTVQDLEYAPILSLSALPHDKIVSMSRDAAEKAALVMIDTDLHDRVKSPEYKDGMFDQIIAILSGTKIKPRFSLGSCQFDAYLAGCEHGQRLINKPQ